MNREQQHPPGYNLPALGRQWDGAAVISYLVNEPSARVSAREKRWIIYKSRGIPVYAIDRVLGSPIRVVQASVRNRDTGLVHTYIVS